ncbi:sensor histidine kinase [Mastigocoleus testarum]|uniref:histidine kinase n=1 Tax=Mastigocoleus testarum BC008 TaxID=371196 RepID=A0A0V7ZSN4_9CYAN|nr:ATP-binding protein [Mastigocoleus testarum]KST67394.1 ATPase [Mastigocoleus testarum BC008]
MKKFSKLWRTIDSSSLRFRLTAGIAILSTVALGGLAGLTSWRMQQILIQSHKDNVAEINESIPRDMQVYRQMYSQEEALQKAVDKSTISNTLVWVINSDSKVLAQSKSLDKSSSLKQSQLLALKQAPLSPKVRQLSNRYFVWCGTPLKDSRGKSLGNLFIMHDITRDQRMFITLVQNLSVASVLVIIAISTIIAFYIRHSLQPLRQLSHMTEVISVEDLGKGHLYLENAPSEVRELAKTCNMMLSRLSESWEKERQFVSNISHELRTPLAIVHGYLQSVLRRKQNLTETQKEALETAASEAETTIRLLEDLLELARADSGHLHLKIQYYVLNDIVAEVVEMARQHSNRLIKIEGGNNIIEVKTDYNRLKQILLNLIDNAVKYSPANQPITLSIFRQGSEVIIQICDRGYGIPLQHQSRIFERFYRVDEARNRAGGTGLGLSIVKTLVEQMGGNISVRSKQGEGSTFTVSLPV